MWELELVLVMTASFIVRVSTIFRIFKQQINLIFGKPYPPGKTLFKYRGLIFYSDVNTPQRSSLMTYI